MADWADDNLDATENTPEEKLPEPTETDKGFFGLIFSNLNWFIKAINASRSATSGVIMNRLVLLFA